MQFNYPVTIAAIDHRQSLKKLLHPENPGSTGFEELVLAKKKLAAALADEVEYILIDPVYGKWIVDQPMKAKLLFCLEESGIEGETKLIPNWGVRQAKELGAVGVKLLIKDSQEDIDLAKKIRQECREEGIIFLLETLSREIDRFKQIEADVYKLKYIPEDLSAPWVLLSAGMEFEAYKSALAAAGKKGCSGMAVGRAIWQDLVPDFNEAIIKKRVRELIQIVNQFGKGVKL